MHAAKPSRPPPGVSSNATLELPPVGRAVGTAVEFEVEVVIKSGAIGNNWACGAIRIRSPEKTNRTHGGNHGPQRTQLRHHRAHQE